MAPAVPGVCVRLSREHACFAHMSVSTCAHVWVCACHACAVRLGQAWRVSSFFPRPRRCSQAAGRRAWWSPVPVQPSSLICPLLDPCPSSPLFCPLLAMAASLGVRGVPRECRSPHSLEPQSPPSAAGGPFPCEGLGWHGRRTSRSCRQGQPLAVAYFPHWEVWSPAGRR